MNKKKLLRILFIFVLSVSTNLLAVMGLCGDLDFIGKIVISILS